MRVLIIGSPAEAGAERPERFARMAAILEEAGLEAVYAPSPPASELRALLRELRPELVYAAPSHSADPPGARRNLHELLEEAGLPYLGSPPAAIELALDKAALKEGWRAQGLGTPDWILLSASPAEDEAALAGARDFPYIVKPAREGNSRGIGEDSVVRDPASLRAKALELRSRFGPVLVERFLGEEPDIREFTVAMIGSGPGAFLMPAEIGFKAPKAVRVITLEDKEEHRTLAKPVEEAGLRDRVAAFASRAFAAAGVLDYARCDLLMTGTSLFAIEINGQPMIPDFWFEACARGAGFDEKRCLLAIFLASIERQAASGRPGLAAPPGLLARFSRAELERLRAFV